MELQQGGNVALNTKSDLRIEIQWQPVQINGKDVDASCFILRANGKVSSDADMIFYNQSRSTDGTVELIQRNAGNCVFKIQPSKLNSAIDKLAFVTTIHDAQGTSFSQAQRIELAITDNANGNILCRYAVSLTGRTEAALIIGEIYRKNTDWKFRAVGQGFVGGLAPLATHYGINIAADTPSPITPSPQIRLEKKLLSLEKTAPHLVSLAKKATISLEKKQLSQVVAKVGLVLDASGSMNNQYATGRVQEVVDRILPLAIHFDDDGSLDCWAFAQKAKELDAVTLSNIKNYVNSEWGGWHNWMSNLNAGINYEPEVMRAVIKKYNTTQSNTSSWFGIADKVSKATSTIPAYVIFISDGGVGSSDEIEKLLIQSSKMPIFWQFVGIGGSSYGVLEHFDKMSGRYIDNCNFFALDDLHSISDQELYDRLLNEFPQWLQEAKKKKLI